MDFRYIACIVVCLIPCLIKAQYLLEGTIFDKQNNQPIPNVEVFDKISGKGAFSNAEGVFQLPDLPPGNHTIIFFSEKYLWKEKEIFLNANKTVNIILESSVTQLPEVIILGKRRELFDLKRLKDVQGTTIYAGKKNEVVLVEQIVGNKSNNTARQVYAQVVGLNIYESTNCGLQLAIGGRGLDPNRTSNFNTRQNGYDISADVLGYPESYYTPPIEALREIQITRGAASLQYGTQFGGLINYRLKPPAREPIKVISRHTYDSNCGYSTFNSFSGTLDDFSYFSYINYKNSLNQTPRPNMDLDAINFYTQLNYQFSDKTKIALEYTYLNYTAQQPGGVTDAKFYEDYFFSNRNRNWFRINWNLFSFRFNHQFNAGKQINIVLFGLNSSRYALGFRVNRVSQVDDPEEPRDLQKGRFRNWGTEIRYLVNYNIVKKKTTLLLGGKYYQAYNSERQGPGSKNSDANFSFVNYTLENLPIELRQSDFNFPNLNIAFFGENIFYLSNKFSITPGFRFEYIKTESEGTYRSVDRDLANNIIRDSIFADNRNRERTKFLLGIGLSYKPKNFVEFYGNISQNYRSVTFTDIRIVNPTFQIDPNINDEQGFTIDTGIRGRYKKVLSYDANVFGLLYDDRLSEVLRAQTRINANGQVEETGKIVRFRGNLGKAFIYGLESLIDWNIRETFYKSKDNIKLSFYVNLAVTSSEYLASEIPNVKGNQVEFIPLINLRTGLKFGYKNLLGEFQFTYLSDQFTDASNAPQNINDNQSGILGTIPAYYVSDISLSYTHRQWKMETGLNNLFNERYFTQRATGYPGPGIIPALPRSIYVTLQWGFKN